MESGPGSAFSLGKADFSLERGFRCVALPCGTPRQIRIQVAKNQEQVGMNQIQIQIRIRRSTLRHDRETEIISFSPSAFAHRQDGSELPLEGVSR